MVRHREPEKKTENRCLLVGIENFAEIRSDEYYYVDKTQMIRELFLRRGKVNLFIRPRRFGKSLNMSMLKYFFGIGDGGSLFQGFTIAEERELCEKYMGRFPIGTV